MNKKTGLSENRHLLNITLGILLLFMGVWVLIIGRTIILPLLLAVFLSFILDPVVCALTRIKIPLGIAVFLTLIFAIIILYLFGLVIYANVQSFVEQFPIYQERLLTSVHLITQKLELWLGGPLKIKIWNEIDWIDTFQRYSIAQGVLSSLGTFLTFLAKMLIVIVFIAYLLTGKRNVNKKIRNAFNQKQAERIIRIIENVTGQVQTYLGAKTISSFITAAVSIIIFYLFGLDFAIFGALLFSFLTIFPRLALLLLHFFRYCSVCCRLVH